MALPAAEVRIARDAELEQAVALRWRWVRERGGEPEIDEAAYVRAAAAWAREHADSHVPFVAIVDGAVVGMAWLAISSRVPTPDRLERRSGDLQSCYVRPEHRGSGLGGALTRAVLDAARARGIEHVTVHSSPRAAAMYAANGFRPSARLLYADAAETER